MGGGRNDSSNSCCKLCVALQGGKSGKQKGSHLDDSAASASEDESRTSAKPGSSSFTQAAPVSRGQPAAKGTGLPSDVKTDGQSRVNGISLPSAAAVDQASRFEAADTAEATQLPSSSSPGSSSSGARASASSPAQKPASISRSSPSGEALHNSFAAGSEDNTSSVPKLPISSSSSSAAHTSSSSPATTLSSSASVRATPSPKSSSQSEGSAGKAPSSTSSASPSTSSAKAEKDCSGAVPSSPADTSSRSSRGFGERLKGKARDRGRASTESASDQSSVSQAAAEAAAETAVGQAAESPILKVQHIHRKPAIWAAATATGRPRNSPAPPRKRSHSPAPQPPPADPAQSPFLPYSGAKAQTATSKPTQSEPPVMVYVEVPKVDGNGCPTGAVEVVPGLTSTTSPGITSSPLQSSSATESSAAEPSVQSVPQSSAGRPIQTAVERIEYITRPQIDPLGRPTGAVEVVPASLVPSGTAPIGFIPIGTTPAGTTSSVGDSVAMSKAQDRAFEASKPNQAQIQRLEFVARPQIDVVGRPTGAVELVPASSLPAGTTPDGTTPAGTTPVGTTSGGSSSGDAVTGNVVSVSEALSRAADKAKDGPGQSGAVANRPGASSNKPGAAPKQTGAAPEKASTVGNKPRATPNQAGAAPDKAGVGVAGEDEQCWKQSKIERSTSWKTR